MTASQCRTNYGTINCQTAVVTVNCAADKKPAPTPADPSLDVDRIEQTADASRKEQDDALLERHES